MRSVLLTQCPRELNWWTVARRVAWTRYRMPLRRNSAGTHCKL
uniref:Uncharacterized protein n=1 Tax=Anguilla anguilla TaxID=7936 RepID=A0A0E9PAJ1_ANGAN